MTPGQMPRPTWPSDRHYIPTPDCFRKKLPCGYFGNLPRDMPRDMWIILTRESFQLLIRHALSQPSNGTVRRVDPPDEETRFVVAYGFAPDKELIRLLEKIYNKHGDVTLQHDGRDSTGKHWIKCFSKVRPGTFERAAEKATICVFSKFELATVTSLKLREEAAAKKEKETTAKAAPREKEKREWPPKVPGALAGAPEYLCFLPWKRQLPFLTPDAAKELRERKLREMETWSRMVNAEAEAKEGARGLEE